MLVSCNETPKVLKPTDRPLDFPSSTISPQFATVLCVGLPSVTTMRANQIDSTTLQPLSQRITIGSRVVDQATRFASKDSFFNKRFNQRYFVRTSAGCVDSKREPSRVGKNHDLGSFTSLGLANLFTLLLQRKTCRRQSLPRASHDPGDRANELIAPTPFPKCRIRTTACGDASR